MSRNDEILDAWLGGQAMSEIARERGMFRQRVHQIIKAELRKRPMSAMISVLDTEGVERAVVRGILERALEAHGIEVERG